MEAESQPPLPPTSTHPLFKVPASSQPHQQPNAAPAMNYQNSSDAPKIGMFPNSQQHQSQKNAGPWEREEREREHEIRREQIRQWRDQQIVELSLLPARSQQQEEQLKTLVLERDFERRAQEEDIEDENENQYQKNIGNIQEVLRLQPSSNGQASQQILTSTRLKQGQGDMKPSPNNISPNAENSPPLNENSHYGMPPPIQPKSILKSRADAYNGSNPSSPSKAPKSTSFAQQNLTELTISNTTANQMITQLNKDLGELKLDFQEESNVQAPPLPPERGSSFAVMNQKVRTSNNLQKISFNDQINNNKYAPTMNNNNNNNDHSPMMSPSGTFTAQQIQQQLNLINNNSNFVRDNKRVSFHDHENNNNNIGNNSEIVSEHDLSREDPNVSCLFVCSV
jgi:afadin